MSERAKYHYPADGELICGCRSFRALAEARDACSKCQRRVEDLLHAVRVLGNRADFSGLDKRTVRAIEFAFSLVESNAEEDEVLQ